MPIPQSIGADSSAQQHIYDVFLCHHSGDKPQVEALAARLEDEGGVKPFLDKWHLIPGEPWQEALEEALDRSRTCAVFLGPSGLGLERTRRCARLSMSECAINHSALFPSCYQGQNRKIERHCR